MTKRMAISADATALDELRALAKSLRRDEAYRALAVLWMLEGVGDAEIARRLEMPPPTVRMHRISFARHGVAGLRAKPRRGREAVKGPAAVAVAERLVRERKEDDPPVTLARIQAAFLAETGQTIDAGHLSVVLRKKGFSWRKPRHTLTGRQDLAAVAAGRARLAELKRQAAAGAIRLLFGDESEVSTHPYLAHTWAPKGFDLKVQAPGQTKRRALLGVRDAIDGAMIVEVARTKRSSDFLRLLERLDRQVGPGLGRAPVVLVLDNGPIHKSKATTKALEERSSWLTPYWLPAYAPELNDIERDWRTLKRLHIANRVLRGEAELEAAVHDAIHAINQARGVHVVELSMAA